MMRAPVSVAISALALGLLLVAAAHQTIADPSVSGSALETRSAGGSIARSFAGDETTPALERIREQSAGTYIGDILRERDSALVRWPDRHGVPLTVWIQPASRVHDFAPAFVTRVRRAFSEWDGVRLPVRFAFIGDSARADVHVTWIDHFSEPISGRTRWSHDASDAITDANIVLAVHHSQGDVLDEDAVGAMALHEIGHLLGLDHTSDTLAIMAPRVRIRRLADADRATARLLYSLPPGPLN